MPSHQGRFAPAFPAARLGHHERPGHWANESGWPSSGIEAAILHLNNGTLDLQAGDDECISIRSPQTTGQCTPFLGSYGAGEPEDPVDQRPDDATSACFDGRVLEEAISILGAPVVNLDVASDQENTFVCVRLNEVLPSGESLQISYGILNLTHRASHEFPEALEPGKKRSALTGRLRRADGRHQASKLRFCT